MRIISGTARGRKLKAPPGLRTRPTPDRVREALFSMLAGEVQEARVLDLFAGSGALGLEALSRGAARATFVESDRRAAAVLRRNLEILPDAPADVLTTPADRALRALAAGGSRFDIAFLDPPYDAGLLAPALARLAELDLMADSAVIVCEHRGGSDPPPPPARWALTETRRFGDVALTFYRPETAG